MAQIVTIKMSKFDNQPWGFRIQGGIDFAAPLAVQKVNGGGLAEKAGLRVGDALLRVNGMDIYQLRHKDAQDAVSRAGNNFELVVSRGGGLPRTGGNKQADPLPQPQQQQQQPIAPVAPVQQKPDGGNVKLVNRQFNSPMGLYSEENIAETLSSQAEVLAQGVLGVNFKKNEKLYDPGNSEVFKMLQEMEKAPREPEPERSVHFAPQMATPPAVKNFTSFPANNIGSTPPVGGVRIFPAGPAPSGSPYQGMKPFSPVQQQVKTHEEIMSSVMQQQEQHQSHVTNTTAVVESSSSISTSVSTSAVTEETLLFEELVAAAADDHAQPEPLAAPSGIKPVSFTPAAHRPLEDSVMKVQWPPVAAEPEESAGPPPAEFSIPEEPAEEPVIPPPAPSPKVEILAPLLPPLEPLNTIAAPQQPAASQVPPYVGGYVAITSASATTNTNPLPPTSRPPPDAGNNGFGAGAAGSSPKGSASGLSAPRRGRGVLNNVSVGPGARVPVCASCSSQIRGKFVTALGLTWCPNHFLCATPQCRRELHEVGFVEEQKKLYCEGCFEAYLAPTCARCSKRVKGDCLNAIGKQFHPECFACTYCGRLFGNSHFYLEDGLPYCEADWNELFTTKCYACGFPIEAGDRWVEAMNNNYHSQCFTCSVCKKNLEGQSFLGKGGKPMCKSHAR